ncbi:MAG TPA: DUF559 domain-containing protein [Candidatus Dormibacteraeota bacterium]|nr:DUF559 domain-containing protein [Candidatus Dormibacteraeota bacterium]
MAFPKRTRARELRANMTAVERRVWYRLRGRQVAGHKFRRQFPVGPYFVDFMCLAARLAIEVDGPLHEEESDRRKSAYLESQGFRVVRMPVEMIDEHFEDVIESIWRELNNPPTPP